ncbi:MAG: hypothetical protein JOY84_21040 [Curvibacter sp.]|nr:hypothetical protein [Curvibacter sp.]
MISDARPGFDAIPDFLLSSLGCASQHLYLSDGLVAQGCSPDSLLQISGGRNYPFRIPDLGMSLMLQCLNPKAPQTSLLWGLHAISLHGAPLHGQSPWPGGLTPGQSTAEDVAQCFGLSADTALLTPELVCFSHAVQQRRPWAVQCEFDRATSRLHTLSLIRTGDWVTASTLPPWPVVEPVPAPVDVEPVTCRSGQLVPQTGVWEASLPPGHPKSLVIAQAPHRYAYRRAGESMVALGLAAFDEAQVLWSWLRRR